MRRPPGKPPRRPPRRLRRRLARSPARRPARPAARRTAALAARPSRPRIAALALLAALGVLSGCGGEPREAGDEGGARPGDRPPPAADTGAPPAGLPPRDSARPDTGVHTREALDAAAREVIGFLRGERGLENVRLADTVALRLAPEGGGARRAVPREQLRERAGWVVPANGSTYRLVPPQGSTSLATAVERHFNCVEGALAEKAPDLAALPHVGTRLQPPEPASCLQSWNLTLVFDPEARPPTLVAAFYDQWEW